MKEYTVTVEIQHGGYSLTSTETVEAYSEQEAKEAAEEKVRDNLLVNATEVEVDDEDEDE